MIERTFRDIEKEDWESADQNEYLIHMGLAISSSWTDLLECKRVLILSEAGSGKTFECRHQASDLCKAGEVAFFLELASLGSGGVRDQLDMDEEDRFDAWLSSQSDVATFFLDSVDELKLTAHSFESALKRLQKSIGRERLGRAKIVITSRPVSFDREAFCRILPVPRPDAQPNEESFADIAMGKCHNRSEDKGIEEKKAFRTVALMPLTDEQILDFARDRGVDDPELLLRELKQRNAVAFARRPQDLIELCSGWQHHKMIRTHREQVESNVQIKLKPSPERKENIELSLDKAMEGASRLAFAMMLMRRWTIRHNANADTLGSEPALDPAGILSDWSSEEIKTLLERALFGFASYGRVRLHHRSVVEYLAARRILDLCKGGMSVPCIKRLLFAERRGRTFVLPSKRAVAGWLALEIQPIYETLRDHEPEVLINHGDPESLSLEQRKSVFCRFVEKYKDGGGRGHALPQVQIHRLASPGMASDIKSFWGKGIENPEIRRFILLAIEAGRITDCADIAFEVATDFEASSYERGRAICTLVALKDGRLYEIASEIAKGRKGWPDEVARDAITSMFPEFFGVDQLCDALSWIKKTGRTLDRLEWLLPRLIENSGLDEVGIETLRGGLTILISEGLRQEKSWERAVSNRQYLSGALAATCARGFRKDPTDEWLHSSFLALWLRKNDYRDDTWYDDLEAKFAGLSEDVNSRLFRLADTLLQSLRPELKPWGRFWRLIDKSPVSLKSDRDLGWIKAQLGDRRRSLEDRAFLLEAAKRLCPENVNYREFMLELRKVVEDVEELSVEIDNFLKPCEPDEQFEKRQAKIERNKRKREQEEVEDRESWLKLWREVANHLEEAFSEERGFETAWDLWNVMRHEGDYSHTSGWNRRFIEQLFDKETADRLRLVLMTIWRKEKPVLPFEWADEKRDTVSGRWRFGQVGIYAESEDPDWASRLTAEEAEHASRYLFVDYNGLPVWFEALAGQVHFVL